MNKKTKEQVVMWFRRDLRLYDNTALYFALKKHVHVVSIFIFDRNILDFLEKDDARVTFIYDAVLQLKSDLQKNGSDLRIFYGNPEDIFILLAKEHDVLSVYVNEDYEPYARLRDKKIKKIIEINNGVFQCYKDHVLFAPDEIKKNDNTPYVVYTPYKKKWLDMAEELMPYSIFPSEDYLAHLIKIKKPLKWIKLKNMGFIRSHIRASKYRIDETFLENYNQSREYPSDEHGTSRIGPYLRFGIVSIREIARKAAESHDKTFLYELIWRNFFQMIIFYYPKTTQKSFKVPYDYIVWNNNKKDFMAWCEGKTGYPLVDAGMRELRATGHMHNRVRMVAASFLCKHLLIDWRWGERYFARYLLDFELASNVGNWQWAAGSGCDAAPYFRIFNPKIQLKKFDPDSVYIKKWLPELNTEQYPKPIVEHRFARERVFLVYKKALKRNL